MSPLLNLLRYIGLFIIVVLLAGTFAHQSWVLYQSAYHEPGGSWIDLSDLVGLMLNYIFLLPAFFVLFGEKRKYIVTAVFLIPIFFYEFSSHFLFLTQHIMLAISGLLVGYVGRVLATKTLGKMQQFEHLKKYF